MSSSPFSSGFFLSNLNHDIHDLGDDADDQRVDRTLRVEGLGDVETVVCFLIISVQY